MAITTLDQVIAGFKNPVPIFKTGGLMAVVGAMRGYTPWYANGNPGASSLATVGLNGAALTPASAAVEGRLPRANPLGGLEAHLGRLAMCASSPGTLMLIDRLWHNNGMSPSSTATNNLAAAALPPRDNNGTTLGAGVMAAVEWGNVGGAGTPTVSLTYTNSAGVTSRSTNLVGVTTPPVGTFEIFPLALGDTGIRAPVSFTQSATRSSGAQFLVLFRQIASIDLTSANIGNAVDALTSGMPQIYDDSILQLLWFPSTTTAVNFSGQYLETQG